MVRQSVLMGPPAPRGPPQVLDQPWRTRGERPPTPARRGMLTIVLMDFGGYQLDDDRRTLEGPEGPIHLERQVYDVLHHLLTNRHRVVPKEELLDEVWGDRFVSESTLTSRIKAARRAIGDDGQAQHSIRTVHGIGYRFVAEVVVDGAAGDGDGAAGDGDGAAVAVTGPSVRLPEPRTRLIGRDAELPALVDLLDEARLVGLVGP